MASVVAVAAAWRAASSAWPRRVDSTIVSASSRSTTMRLSAQDHAHLARFAPRALESVARRPSDDRTLPLARQARRARLDQRFGLDRRRASKPSTMLSAPSACLAESTERSARRRIFAGISARSCAGAGRRRRRRRAHAGRDAPWRARPVPFWRHGLRPPPRTSPRVWVSAVPARLLASWRTTAWWMSASFGVDAEDALGQRRPRRAACRSASRIGRSAGHRLLRLLRTSRQAVARARHGAANEDQVALGVDCATRQLLDGHAARRPCGRPCACP